MIRTFDPLLPKQIWPKQPLLAVFRGESHRRESRLSKCLNFQCLSGWEDVGSDVPVRPVPAHVNPWCPPLEWQTCGKPENLVWLRNVDWSSITHAFGAISLSTAVARSVSPLRDGTQGDLWGEGHSYVGGRADPNRGMRQFKEEAA